MPRVHLRLSLRLLGVVVLVSLAVALGVKIAIARFWPHLTAEGRAQSASGPVVRRRNVADLLANQPALGETVEVDAYFSGAGDPSAQQLRPSPDEQPCATDWGAVLSDQPFQAVLSVLGGFEANALPGDVPWLSAVSEAGQPLPYRARFRGHLREPSDAEGCPPGTRVFVVEEVVRTRAERPPATRPPSTDYAAWRRHYDAAAVYSLPCPPRWPIEQVDDATLTLTHPKWPDNPVTVRVHPGETHHDPYDLSTLPALLQGQKWSAFEQASAAGGGAVQGLFGYRIDRELSPGGRLVSVLFSAHGRTYELSVSYPLGLSSPQPLLSGYSAIVAGFSLSAPLAPSPTPPVRQALGAGPFLSAEEAIERACDCLGPEIEPLTAELVPEGEARRLAGPCGTFSGHTDGLWVLTARSAAGDEARATRLFLEAATGRELCREELAADALSAAADAPVWQLGLLDDVPRWATSGLQPRRWIEIILREQTLLAWEGDQLVRRMLVSTGTAQHPTVTGQFRIYHKAISVTMSGPGYVLPGVPHAMFFHEGYAIHGSYWHSNFGTPMSHGCVNLSQSDAAWLFDWAGPRLAEGAYAVQSTPCNPGTLVVVH